MAWMASGSCAGKGPRPPRVADHVDVVGVLVVVGVLAAATVVGLLLRARSGQVSTAGTATDGWALAGRTPAADERVLLLQLSSPVCAPCRQAAGVLGGLGATTAGGVP